MDINQPISWKVIVGVIVIVILGIWVFYYSPIGWGLRSPSSYSDCVNLGGLKSQEQYDQRRLVCNYKGKDFYADTILIH